MNNVETAQETVDRIRIERNKARQEMQEPPNAYRDRFKDDMEDVDPWSLRRARHCDSSTGSSQPMPEFVESAWWSGPWPWRSWSSPAATAGRWSSTPWAGSGPPRRSGCSPRQARIGSSRAACSTTSRARSTRRSCASPDRRESGLGILRNQDFQRPSR